jgi:hypothetical protein
LGLGQLEGQLVSTTCTSLPYLRAMLLRLLPRLPRVAFAL